MRVTGIYPPLELLGDSQMEVTLPDPAHSRCYGPAVITSQEIDPCEQRCTRQGYTYGKDLTGLTDGTLLVESWNVASPDYLALSLILLTAIHGR